MTPTESNVQEMRELLTRWLDTGEPHKEDSYQCLRCETAVFLGKLTVRTTS